MKNLILILTMTVFMVSACKKDDEPKKASSVSLVGTWYLVKEVNIDNNTHDTVVTNHSKSDINSKIQFTEDGRVFSWDEYTYSHQVDTVYYQADDNAISISELPVSEWANNSDAVQQAKILTFNADSLVLDGVGFDGENTEDITYYER